MGSYNTAVITTAGQALLTSILANQGTLTFSKFQTSSYQYASGTDLSALTSLNSVEQEVTPSGAGIIDSTTLYATSTVSNSGLAAEYTAYTLGLFISDGVDEVLFAVATAIVPDVIPEDIGGTPSTYIYSLQLSVSSTEDITINVDMDAYLTADSVIDNLTSTSVNSPLSANQGKTLNDNKAERTDISSIITTGTKNTTGTQIASGTYFYLNGQLVKAKTDIAVNANYTLNTNYEVATVGGVLTELNSNLTELDGRISFINTNAPSTVSSSRLVDLPSGFNRNNCMIIGVQITVGAHYDLSTISSKSTSANIQVCISANEDKIDISTDANVNSVWLNKPIKIALLKYQ